MKKAKIHFSLVAALLLLTAALCACSRGFQPAAPSAEIPSFDALVRRQHPADVIKPPRITRWAMANGLTVLFLEDEELPLVSGSLYLRGGSLQEKENEVGSISAMGDQMRQGGAGTLSADDLDRELEMLSAGIASSFGPEFGNVSFSCLETDLDRVFQIFADVILQPRFEKDRLDLWQGQALESIRRRADDPDTVAGLSFRQLVYGGTPYGRVVTDSDVKRINQEQLRSLHRRFVRPNGAVLAVSGKISREKLESLTSRSFSAWEQRSGTGLPQAPQVDFMPAPGIYFITQPLAQATIFMGQQGVPRLTPDHLAIEVFNQIFGSGGFGALLTRRVRSELGLAYGIFGGVLPGVVKGRNLIILQTRADAASQAILQAAAVLQNMKEVPPLELQMEETKRSIENSFVFNFDSPWKVVIRETEFELLGYPKDYDTTYLPGIMALTPEDIRQVARDRWQIRDFVIVVVGNETAYRSIEDLVKDPSGIFNGFVIRRVGFDQKLQLE